MTSSAEATVLLDEASVAAPVAEISGDRYRHLFRARRLAVGDRLRVVDGLGRARRGTVVRVDRATAAVELGDELPALEPALALTLVVGALRKERASWLVEKATELGVAAVRFVSTSRTPREYGEGTLERWRRIAAAAVEQCGRARLPEVTGVHAWPDHPALAAGADRLQVLARDGAALAPMPPSVRSAVLFVGPEGGFSPEERDGLLALGARPAGLGGRTLRVETAALAGTAILLTGNGLR